MSGPDPVWPRTVLGTPVAPSYDVVLAHEHVFIDIRCWLDRDHRLYEQLRDRRVDDESLPLVRQHPFACPDNVVLDDADLMAAELAALPEDSLIIDVTPEEVGRDTDRLAEISRRTDVDIVTGCGSYVEESWPPDRRTDSEDAFTRRILDRFAEPRPPAVIGEIGTGSPITEAEQRSLRGAARAQAELGVPLYLHLHPWSPQTQHALDIVERGGGDLERTVLCHLDVTATRSVDDARLALDRGCYVAFDIWGDEDAYGEDAMPRDVDRAATAYRLAELGYGKRLVHSQDVCTKSQLSRFGGAGYAHTHTAGRSALLATGLSTDQVHDQLAGNALRLLIGDRYDASAMPSETFPDS